MSRSLHVRSSSFFTRHISLINARNNLWHYSNFRRLRQDKGGGAWCPKDLVTKEGKEYLEVNLHTPRLLTSTRTQGRFGNGHGVEYTEEYFVEYWRPGFNKWVRWRNRRGIEVGTIWLPHRSNRARDFFLGSHKPELTAHQQILDDSSNFSIGDYTREYANTQIHLKCAFYKAIIIIIMDFY